MQEAVRSAMLSAMGQQVLVPRFVLANAKASEILVGAIESTADALAPSAAPALDGLPVENTSTNTTPDIPQPNLAEQQVADTAAAYTNQPATSDNSVKVSLAASLMTSDEANSSTGLGASLNQSLNKATALNAVGTKQYRHRIINFSNLVFLLDQPMLEWVEEKVTFNFLHDVYFALREQKTQLIEQQTFDWPPGRLKLADDQAAAVEHTFLQEQINSCDSEWLICWGVKAAQQFVISEQTITVGSTHLLDGFKVLVLDELKAYWKSPEKKQLLWQDLQVVRKSLKP